MAFITIDIGTSVAKVAAFDDSGRAQAEAHVTYPTQRPQPGWAEQDPDDWWKAVCRATRSVVRQLSTSKANIEGIGLTGQMHGLVLLGRTGNPLIPCLIWMDTRAENCARKLCESLGEALFLSRTGNPIVPAFPITKLLWVREHLPHIHKETRWVVMPKDYLGFRLTGEIATDPSDASGTLLYNSRLRDWDDELLAAVGVSRELLPPIKPSTSRLGKVTLQAAKELRVPAGTPVVVGAGDLATSALGVGAITPERVGLILGTAGQLLFTLNEFPHQLLGRFYFFVHAIPESYLGLGTLPTGGAALAWLARVVWPSGSFAERKIEKLVNLAKTAPPGANGLFFLPYLAGTGTPYMDYKATGILLGLTEAHGLKQIVRAVLEGVGYALRDSLQLLQDFEIGQKEIMIAGGSMRSQLFRQIIADILGRPLQLVRVLDVSPLGAFLLTAVGLGLQPNLRKACEAMIKVQEIIAPTEASRYYSEKFMDFRELSQKWRSQHQV